uniref:Uncharacterized protein n=1 Tax=Anguilla anguilla TaxID=7936 RepID=A0A0E9QMT9_ANGAN
MCDLAQVQKSGEGLNFFAEYLDRGGKVTPLLYKFMFLNLLYRFNSLPKSQYQSLSVCSVGYSLH